MTRLLRLNGLLVLAAAIVVALWIRAVGGFEGIAGLPAPGPMLPPAPVSNSITRSEVFTSSGCRESSKWSAGSLAACSSPATSAGVWPTPNTLLSFGSEIVPSRSAIA